MIKKNLLALFALFFSVTTVMAFTSCSDDDDDIKVESDYTEAFNKKFPNTKGVKWERKGAYKVAEFRQNRFEVEAWFDADARWCMTDTDYGRDRTQLPAAVDATVTASEYASWTIEDIDYYERTDLNFYVVELETKGMADVYMFISPDGDVLKVQSEPMADVTPTTPVL